MFLHFCKHTLLYFCAICKNICAARKISLQRQQVVLLKFFQMSCIVPSHQLPVFSVFTPEHRYTGVTAERSYIRCIYLAGSMPQHPLDSSAVAYQQQSSATILFCQTINRDGMPLGAVGEADWGYTACCRVF